MIYRGLHSRRDQMSEASEAKAALVAVRELRERIHNLELRADRQEELREAMENRVATLELKRAETLAAAMDKLAGIEQPHAVKPASATSPESERVLGNTTDPVRWTADAAAVGSGSGSQPEPEPSYAKPYDFQQTIDNLKLINEVIQEHPEIFGASSASPNEPAAPSQPKQHLAEAGNMVASPAELPPLPERPSRFTREWHYEWGDTPQHRSDLVEAETERRYGLALESRCKALEEGLAKAQSQNVIAYDQNRLIERRLETARAEIASLRRERDERVTKEEAMQAMRLCEKDNISSGYDEILDHVLSERAPKEAGR